MQMSFAVGFFLAALLNLIIGPIGWRFVLAAGAAPALLTLGIRRFVPEPKRWIAARYGGPAMRAKALLTRPRARSLRYLRRGFVVERSSGS